MAIERWAGSAPGRSRVVRHAGTVYTVATARDKAPSVGRQTADALAVIDRNLAEAGTDKSQLLSATVYITDMAHKPEMDAVWRAWVDPAGAPQRACVAVALDGDDLVEIVVTAAVRAA
jgi:enamine deaminase RidA (YjgF/YER057c/UK114 family)